ncbi:hypothetical protein GCM10023196_073470 [Actinoallomurus vinaceus]|uniref:Uncharacterized protein n=1 Tax=Actinoallomurus vinaceus TaxID=1080074 RepID=A0ABP8UMV1_9ACTN
MRIFISGLVNGLTSAIPSLSPAQPDPCSGRERARALPISDDSHGSRSVISGAGWAEIVADTDAPGRLNFLEVAR